MKQVYLDTLGRSLKVLENTEDETDSYFDIKYSMGGNNMYTIPDQL